MGVSDEDDFEREGGGMEATEELVNSFDGPLPEKSIPIRPSMASIAKIEGGLERTRRALDRNLKGTFTARTHHDGPHPLTEVARSFHDHFPEIGEAEQQVNKPSRKSVVERMLEKLQAELVRLEQLPDEPKAPGNSPFPPVVYFRKQFPGADREYTYLTFKAPHDGRWYVSGATQVGKSYTWDELMYWLENSGPLPTLYLVGGFHEYFAPEDDEDSGE